MNTTMCRTAHDIGSVIIIHISEWPSIWRHKHNHVHARMADRGNYLHVRVAVGSGQHKHNHVQDGPRYGQRGNQLHVRVAQRVGRKSTAMCMPGRPTVCTAFTCQSGPAHGRMNTTMCRTAHDIGSVTIIHISEWPSTWRHKHNHVHARMADRGNHSHVRVSQRMAA